MVSWKRALKSADLARVEAAVAAAESRCNGEFVVCVVRRSSGVGHVPYALALLCIALFSAADFSLLPEGYYGPRWPYLLCEAALAALLCYFLGQRPWLQRLFTLKHERSLLVHRRARLEFFQNHLEKTKGGTGVLLFVSLMERQAVVLADKSIAAKVPEHAWNGVLQEILKGVGRGDLGSGLMDALEHSARIVAAKFPRRGKKKNELSNRVIVKE